MKNLHVIVVILALSWITLSQAGGVYKCMDKQGQIYYADRPCHGVMTQETLEVKSQSSSKSAPLLENERRAKQQKLLHTWQEERKNKQRAEDKAQKQEEQRSRNCTAAKSRLQLFESVGRLFKVDENGKRHYYSEAERAQKLQETKKQVEYWCQS